MAAITTRNLPTLASEGGLSRYLQEIRKFPMLEPNEEYMLAKRWREHDDSEAAHLSVRLSEADLGRLRHRQRLH